MVTNFSQSPADKKTLYQNFFKDKKVLIVEDDVFLGGILFRHMADMKINVNLVTKGSEVLDAIIKNVPDIMVLDIFLPETNGLDLLESLRKNKVAEKLPVLIVSNTDQLKDRQKAERLDAEFVLKAVVTPANILDRLYVMLSQRQIQNPTQ